MLQRFFVKSTGVAPLRIGVKERQVREPVSIRNPFSQVMYGHEGSTSRSQMSGSIGRLLT